MRHDSESEFEKAWQENIQNRNYFLKAKNNQNVNVTKVKEENHDKVNKVKEEYQTSNLRSNQKTKLKLKKKTITVKSKENDIEELEEVLKSNYDNMKNIVY